MSARQPPNTGITHMATTSKINYERPIQDKRIQTSSEIITWKSQIIEEAKKKA